MRVGFSQNEYSVVEDDGNGNGNEVEICINLSGTLERDVTVYLTTSSGSAIGDIVAHWFSTYTCIMVQCDCFWTLAFGLCDCTVWLPWQHRATIILLCIACHKVWTVYTLYYCIFVALYMYSIP